MACTPGRITTSKTCLANACIDMDKMVSIKGLVIRTTPVIPDMKTGKYTSRFKTIRS